MLDEVHEEAKLVCEEKISSLPGRVTIGIDGHKMGKRHVETLTRAKLGISTFLHAELLSTKRATGKYLFELVKKHIDETTIAIVADNTGNNTGRRTGLFALLKQHKPSLLCLGCCVHVLDLLVEDVAKMAPIQAAANDAHFLTTFVKQHALLYEQFLESQKLLNVKVELVLFPLTRFAYAHLMCMRVVKNFSVLRLLSESNAFEVLKGQASKRGGEQGQKQLPKFKRFEEIAGSRPRRNKIQGAAMLLEPLSTVLHYLEGDGTPVSHVYPCYQLIYDYVQQLSTMPEITEVLASEDDQDKVSSLVRERWLGVARKTGLQDKVHFCAFALDPYAQAAITTNEKPDCDLLTNEVTEAARNVFKQICPDPSQRAILIEQFGLWCAATPRRSIGRDFAEDSGACQSGNNAFSSLYLTGMQLVWDKVKSFNMKQQDQQQQATSSTTKHLSAVKCSIANLKVCSKPTEFWLAMSAEAPRGAGAGAIQAHRFFCKVACEISAIVSHTAGVERAGKGYGLVLTTLRQSLSADRALKSVYCLENYGLLSLHQEVGGGFQEFMQSHGANQGTAQPMPRGNLIVDDVPADLSDDAGSTSASDAGELSDPDDEVEAISWSIPRGFKVAPKPSAINEQCVGLMVYMKWEKFGWQLGKVTDLITSATPRLARSFNVRVSWSDGRGPCKLDLNIYAHGDDAPENAWVFLEQKNDREAEESDDSHEE